ncbi:MAG: LysR family transcriptional regulator [Lachnospiraceae bacterium]|nr:LysR family transcriptional regulator [Lachnospiraceae bacterium]
MDLIYHNGNSDITLNQIYTFIVVAEYGNFTKASAELHISQPSISKTISKLEEVTGLSLFIRNPRGAILTNTGRILYQEWKKALDATQIGYEKACSVLNHNKFIRIGVPRSFSGSTQIFPIIQEFAQTCPDIEIHMEEADSPELRRGIACDKYDVIFAPSYEYDYYHSNGYLSRLFHAAPIELCIGKSHVIAGREFFSKDLLKDETLLILPEEIAPDYHSFILKICEKHQIPYSSVSIVSGLQAAYISLIRGQGYFLSSGSWFPGSCSDGFNRYQLSTDKGGILMVWDKNSTNPSVNELKKCIHY